MTLAPAFPNKVWATLLTNSAYLAGVLTLYRTLKAVSAYPLVIMATESLPQSSREVLKHAGLEIVDVEHLTPASGQHNGFDPTFVRLNDAWTKLRVFGLTQYDRVVLIDSDMIFLRGMDEIFDFELPGDDWIAAAPACICNPLKIAHYPEDWQVARGSRQTPANCAISKQSRYEKLTDPAIPSPDAPRTAHLLNSGMVVLQPRKETLDQLIHFLNTSPTIAASRFADQDVIAEAFHGRWRPLPWWSNALKTERHTHRDVWADTEVRLIHYILDKPWGKHSSFYGSLPKNAGAVPAEGIPEQLLEVVKSTPAQQGPTIYDEVDAWWWIVYTAVVQTMRDSGMDVDLDEMSRGVIAPQAA